MESYRHQVPSNMFLLPQATTTLLPSVQLQQRCRLHFKYPHHPMFARKTFFEMFQRIDMCIDGFFPYTIVPRRLIHIGHNVAPPVVTHFVQRCFCQYFRGFFTHCKFFRFFRQILMDWNSIVFNIKTCKNNKFWTLKRKKSIIYKKQ